jgi:amino acid transporter
VQERLVLDIPLNSVAFSLILTIIIALINLGSSEALSVIFSLYTSALIGSYVITISCALLHRLQGRRLPLAGFSLGTWGVLCNCIALIFLIPIFIFSFFPTAPKPTASAMNWASTLVGGIVLLATGYYVAWGQKLYSPPEETVEDFIQRSEREAGDGADVAAEKSVAAGIEEKRDM